MTKDDALVKTIGKFQIWWFSTWSCWGRYSGGLEWFHLGRLSIAWNKEEEMKHKFGWDLPPSVTNRMIEEQAGAFEEKEMNELQCKDCRFWNETKQDMGCLAGVERAGMISPTRLRCDSFEPIEPCQECKDLCDGLYPCTIWLACVATPVQRGIE